MDNNTTTVQYCSQVLWCTKRIFANGIFLNLLSLEKVVECLQHGQSRRVSVYGWGWLSGFSVCSKLVWCPFCLSKGLLSRIETKPMRLSKLTYYLHNADEHHDIKSS